MEKYYKRKAPEIDGANNSRNPWPDEINWEEEIKYDPGVRKQIDAYHPNHREKVRRKYLENGPCQPRRCNFPVIMIADKPRRFNPDWFDEFGSWLEYSETTDRAYCFCCFLFREKKDAGYDSFVVNGWNGYHRKERLKSHVGDVGGSHFIAMKKCDDLLQREQHIDVVYNQVSEIAKRAYFTRLNGSIDTARLLLNQGLPFRGHDESKESYNRGNFIEFRDCLAEHDPKLGKAVGENGADNSCLLSPDIQRDIVECFANEVLHSILEELGNDVFCLLVDESRDVSCKEQMAVVLRYVDKHGIVKERFVGLVHVTETTSSHLKSSIDSLFAKLKLSLQQVRGQGYDGASNMRAATNSLSLALQRKDQDIVNAIGCVRSTRLHLDNIRRIGWDRLLEEVNEFCDKHEIDKYEMEDTYVDPQQPRKKSGITNKHHYEVDCFNHVIDWLVQELDNRFNETSSQLLVCSAAFNPRDSFHDFNVESLVSLAKLYPDDFNSDDLKLKDLRHQLSLYIADVRADGRFSNINTIAELSQKMVQTSKNVCYPLVYQLLKLVLVLPVATATVERCFSAMNLVKTDLSNKIGDEHLSHRLLCYVEKEIFSKVTNEAVVHRFMTMEGKERKFYL
ncbi:unnamed protein product [Urochloa humidicola]